MAESYLREKMAGTATFNLCIREYPPNRSYFVSAGLNEVLSYIEAFRFTKDDIDYLESVQLFSKKFLRYLEGLRFTGDVNAISEGRIFFRNEPIIEVTAPIIKTQIVETFLINTLNLNITLASKAARSFAAAKGRRLVDFSLRRTQGVDAGLVAARASYISGFSATSNLLADKLYNIPVVGTMAHSYITSFSSELEAFRAFSRAFPENTVLLIDTYDTLEGACKAAVVGKEMLKRGNRMKGVRLDSGDIADLSKGVRQILKKAGLHDVLIFASCGLDEYGIADILDRGGDVDAFGVGTKMGVSADAPYTDSAYRLVAYNGRPVLKLSKGKKTLVYDKQVYRVFESGKMVADRIALRSEKGFGEPVLVQVMKNGERIRPDESLETVRERFLGEFSALDNCCKVLTDPPQYPVGLSPILERLQERAVTAVRKRELGES